MSHATTTSHDSRKTPRTPESISHDWIVVKRDGREVPFDIGRIQSAISRCFSNSAGMSIADAREKSAVIATQVVYFLDSTRAKKHDIEDIQRAVISQLWANDYADAAEHYTIYREERRRAREEESIDHDVARMISEDAKHFPSPLQYFQFLDKYARWDDEKKRRETWRECVDRVMNFFKKQPQLSPITRDEWNRIDEAIYTMQVSPAMRIVQMAGPALDRCGSGAFNCCAIGCNALEVFSEALYLLMQGCGVGFSVESHYVDQLPRIKKQKGKAPETVIVEDSTEGWCKAYQYGILTWADGEDVLYDYSKIRPEGARLKTKGGRASGSGPLKQLLTFARSIILKRQGSWLRTRDCHDIMCMTGKIVQMGGVRRASEISLSDLDDTSMRDAKSGNWWDSSPWLDMSNNSAVYEEKPDAITFMTEWLALAKSGSGERGIFNRYGLKKHIPKRRKYVRFIGNPCNEILLNGEGQMCNLSIAVARHDDTPETLADKVEVATILGTLQSTLTNFSQFLRDIWKQNCDQERLLGVDITGHMDCPILRHGVVGREILLETLKQRVLQTNATFSNRLGIPVSAATTCVKPSGNSAVFFGCSSGMHARWSKYQVRRVRIGRSSPVAMLLKSVGVPHAVDPMNNTLLVFDFLPSPSPEGTPTRNDMTAIEQFHNWLVWKTHWTEHSASCTIYVGPDEWFELGNEIYKNFDKITGLSFLPRDSGTYQLAPNEELTKEDYERRLAEFPVIPWEKLSHFEKEDQTTQRNEVACAGGACEMV